MQISPCGHHRTTLSGYIFATKARIDNRKKIVKQQYLLHMSPQYGELRRTSGWDCFVSLGHPSYFQRLPRLGSVTARQSSSERQPNCAALNRGRHLCSAGRPSRWALAHILVFPVFEHWLRQFYIDLAHLLVYTPWVKTGATLTTGVTLSILDRFAKSFHCHTFNAYTIYNVFYFFCFLENWFVQL